MIGAFLSGTIYESLVHKLGRKGPQTTKELLDIATSHTSGEEAVGAIFDRSDNKARWDVRAREPPRNSWTSPLATPRVRKQSEPSSIASMAR